MLNFVPAKRQKCLPVTITQVTVTAMEMTWHLMEMETSSTVCCALYACFHIWTRMLATANRSHVGIRGRPCKNFLSSITLQNLIVISVCTHGPKNAGVPWDGGVAYLLETCYSTHFVITPNLQNFPNPVYLLPPLRNFVTAVRSEKTRMTLLPECQKVRRYVHSFRHSTSIGQRDGQNW